MRRNLKSCREKYGLTQVEFSKALGITVRQYHRIESGDSDGSIKLWEKIKSLLEQPIDFLLENS